MSTILHTLPQFKYQYNSAILFRNRGGIYLRGLDCRDVGGPRPGPLLALRMSGVGYPLGILGVICGVPVNQIEVQH